MTRKEKAESLGKVIDARDICPFGVFEWMREELMEKDCSGYRDDDFKMCHECWNEQYER